MNILLLTHSYPDKVNTLKCIFIREQAKVLSSFFNVTVVVFKVDYSHFGSFAGYSFSKVISENLTEYTLIVKKSLPGITQVKYLASSYRFIVKEILNNTGIDIIHSHLSYPGGFLGTFVQQRFNIPNILTEHSRISSYARSWFHKLCLNYTFRNSRGIVSVSNSLKDEIISINSRTVFVIPNIVDLNEFKLVDKTPGEIVNIGFLGGLGNYNKGLDLLLESFSLLKRKDFFLHIGGFGSLLEDFRKRAEEMGIASQCRFYGEITRNEIVNFYSGLDLFVLPSRYETFGIVLIEAMASGIPVIATKCGGPQEIVTPETGILIEKNNPEELAEAINYISDNLEKYDKKAIRNYVEKKFGQSTFIENITNLYMDVLNKNFTA
jgi:glycosyltransferase involved in cell wall biosynthesis